MGCLQYADNTQLSLTLPSDCEDAVKSLNQGQEAMMDWIRISKLKLNPVKMEFLWVGHNPTLDSGITPVLDGVAFHLKAQLQSLELLRC